MLENMTFLDINRERLLYFCYSYMFSMKILVTLCCWIIYIKCD